MTLAADGTHDRVMLLSVHPRHVANILAGTKIIELRRTRPDVQVGQPVAIYATSPSAAVVATCRIGRVQVDRPEIVWKDAGDLAQVSAAEFEAYFDGSPIAVALHLAHVSALEEQVPLAHLRNRVGFHPPQTWHFLDQRKLQDLLGDHPSSPALTGLIDPLTV